MAQSKAQSIMQAVGMLSGTANGNKQTIKPQISAPRGPALDLRPQIEALPAAPSALERQQQIGPVVGSYYSAALNPLEELRQNAAQQAQADAQRIHARIMQDLAPEIENWNARVAKANELLASGQLLDSQAQDIINWINTGERHFQDRYETLARMYATTYGAVPSLNMNISAPSLRDINETIGPTELERAQAAEHYGQAMRDVRQGTYGPEPRPMNEYEAGRLQLERENQPLRQDLLRAQAERARRPSARSSEDRPMSPTDVENMIELANPTQTGMWGRQESIPEDDPAFIEHINRVRQIAEGQPLGSPASRALNILRDRLFRSYQLDPTTREELQAGIAAEPEETRGQLLDQINERLQRQKEEAAAEDRGWF